jgi:hypothetical protein
LLGDGGTQTAFFLYHNKDRTFQLAEKGGRAIKVRKV